MSRASTIVPPAEMHHDVRWLSPARPDPLPEPTLPAWQVALVTAGFGAATILTLLLT